MVCNLPNKFTKKFLQHFQSLTTFVKIEGSLKLLVNEKGAFLVGHSSMYNVNES